MASLARIASEEAEKGYEVSIGILKDAGRELAIDAIAVAERLNIANDNIIVGGVGSVFSSRIVRESFRSHAAEELPKATIKQPLIGGYSLVGPIVMVLGKLGIRVAEDDLKRLRGRLSE